MESNRVELCFLARMVVFYCLLMTVSPVKAQNEKLIEVHVRNASLEEFVKYMESVSEYSFIYGEDVRLRHPVSLDMKSNISGILRKAFALDAVNFSLSGKHIILSKGKEKYTISGYITDSLSLETLIGANIIESSRHVGTSTNSFGYYSLTLPAGETELVFSYMGYGSRRCRFTLNKDTLMNLRLGVSSDNSLEEIVVLSDKKPAGIYATEMGTLEIPMTQIRNTPALLGEADILKTIQLMPGVQAGTEGFSGMYVRGGGPDQNLILLDGIPVYNADHMLGVFSVFTPEAVKNVTLFKSSFPARFGGRLSSVIDIRTNDGDMQSYHGTVSIGLLTSKVHLEGPVIKGKTSFCLTARRTYFDFFTKPFLKDNQDLGYYFYDINAKVNHKFSDRSRLFFSFYKGKDHYDYSQDAQYDGYEEHAPVVRMYNDKLNLNWGNTIAALRWNYVYNNKLFSKTTVAYNHYNMQMDGSFRKDVQGEESGNFYRYNSDYHSGITDWSVQSDFEYIPVPAHQIKFGIGYLFHSFRPEVMASRITESSGDEFVQDTTFNTNPDNHLLGHELSVYLEDNFNIGKRFSMNAGVHLSLFYTQGRGYFSAQPRLSLRYLIGKDFAVKTAFSRMSQYVHLLTSSQIMLPTDLWVPVTKRIRPMDAYQYSLGGYYTGLKGWEFSLEGYIKRMNNVLEYQDGASFFASSTGWEEKVEMGQGRSMGMELLIQKTQGKTTGWLGYTLAKSDRQFKDGTINNGKRFPYKYDRRHSISLCVNHKFNDKVDLGISWIFNTGGTASVGEFRTSIIIPGGGITEIDYIPERNNYRLPSSHRLNIGVNFHKKVRRGEHIYNVSVYNIYNAMNPTFVNLEENYIYHEGGDDTGGEVWPEYRPKLKKLTLLPCVPSFTYTFKF